MGTDRWRRKPSADHRAGPDREDMGATPDRWLGLKMMERIELWTKSGACPTWEAGCLNGPAFWGRDNWSYIH